METNLCLLALVHVDETQSFIPLLLALDSDNVETSENALPQLSPITSAREDPRYQSLDDEFDSFSKVRFHEDAERYEILVHWQDIVNPSWESILCVTRQVDTTPETV